MTIAIIPNEYDIFSSLRTFLTANLPSGAPGGFPGEVACEKPGVRLARGVVGLGGGKDEMRVARHQLERIPTPVITHGHSQISFFAMLAVIATLARRAVTP